MLSSSIEHYTTFNRAETKINGKTKYVDTLRQLLGKPDYMKFNVKQHCNSSNES